MVAEMLIVSKRKVRLRGENVKEKRINSQHSVLELFHCHWKGGWKGKKRIASLLVGCWWHNLVAWEVENQFHLWPSYPQIRRSPLTIMIWNGRYAKRGWIQSLSKNHNIFKLRVWNLFTQTPEGESKQLENSVGGVASGQLTKILGILSSWCP